MFYFQAALAVLQLPRFILEAVNAGPWFSYIDLYIDFSMCIEEEVLYTKEWAPMLSLFVYFIVLKKIQIPFRFTN